MFQNGTLVEIKELVVQFELLQGVLPAVNGVTFEIKSGQTLGIVGESGSGKSVTALSILGLVPSPPGRLVGGQIIFHHPSTGETLDMTRLPPKGKAIRAIRGNEIAMIFQEPMTSLTPAYTIGEQIMEAIILHQVVDRAEARQRAIDILDRVGMPQPDRVINSYPHQLSGGMMQRAMIAIALSCRPSLLIADEPTTALDVTTAAQIQELMRNLQENLDMAIMYITHDLGVIAEMADEVVVMYLGRVMEQTDVVSLFYEPQHPYTQGLLNSIPRLGSKNRLVPIRGVVPEPYAIPKGCVFGPRCPKFMPGLCDQAEPPLVATGTQHQVRCYLYT
jgi:oligopeptide/dipeptide ABC transporter ATP-binding protein